MSDKEKAEQAENDAKIFGVVFAIRNNVLADNSRTFPEMSPPVITKARQPGMEDGITRSVEIVNNGHTGRVLIKRGAHCTTFTIGGDGWQGFDPIENILKKFQEIREQGMLFTRIGDRIKMEVLSHYRKDKDTFINGIINQYGSKGVLRRDVLNRAYRNELGMIRALASRSGETTGYVVYDTASGRYLLKPAL